MAMGLPILIAVPDGEATNIVEKFKAGVKVPPEYPEELSEEILKLGRDKDLVARLSQQSLEAAKNFDRKQLALDMLYHLEELVSLRK